VAQRKSRSLTAVRQGRATGFGMTKADGGEPSDGDAVFGLDQAAWVVVRGYVTKADVAGQGAEEGDAVADEHRDSSDDEALHEAGAQKLLNGDPAAHVDVLDAAGSECGWVAHYL
jgi:hypothetical protein